MCTLQENSNAKCCKAILSRWAQHKLLKLLWVAICLGVLRALWMDISRPNKPRSANCLKYKKAALIKHVPCSTIRNSENQSGTGWMGVVKSINRHPLCLPCRSFRCQMNAAVLFCSVQCVILFKKKQTQSKQTKQKIKTLSNKEKKPKYSHLLSMIITSCFPF